MHLTSETVTASLEFPSVGLREAKGSGMFSSRSGFRSSPSPRGWPGGFPRCARPTRAFWVRAFQEHTHQCSLQACLPFSSRVGWSILEYVRRTGTFSACAFREHKTNVGVLQFRVLSLPFFRGAARAALDCAHRTSTVSSCAFCEQGGHLAAPRHCLTLHRYCRCIESFKGEFQGAWGEGQWVKRQGEGAVGFLVYLVGLAYFVA